MKTAKQRRKLPSHVQRMAVRTHRLAPAACRVLTVDPSGQQRWHPSDAEIPDEIHVYLADPTNDDHDQQSDGSDAWRLDQFLSDALQRWSHKPVVLSIVSTDGQIVRRRVLSQLRLLAEQDHKWRLIVVTDGKDLTSTAVIDQVLRSPITELRICGALAGSDAISNRILNAVKDLIDLRNRRRQERPQVLFRLTAGGNEPVDLEQARRRIKQTGADKVEVDGVRT